MDNPFMGLNQQLLFLKDNLALLLKEVQELRDSRSVNSENEDRYIDKKEAAKVAAVSVSTIDN